MKFKWAQSKHKHVRSTRVFQHTHLRSVKNQLAWIMPRARTLPYANCILSLKTQNQYFVFMEMIYACDFDDVINYPQMALLLNFNLINQKKYLF